MDPDAPRYHLARLAPETWGERYTRAYRTFREDHQLVLQDVCERLGEAGINVKQPVLSRFMTRTDLPPREGSRLQAWGSLVCYGFDPADWDLGTHNVNLAGFNVSQTIQLLHPDSWGEAYRRRRLERVAGTTQAQRIRARNG